MQGRGLGCKGAGWVAGALAHADPAGPEVARRAAGPVQEAQELEGTHGAQPTVAGEPPQPQRRAWCTGCTWGNGLSYMGWQAWCMGQ